MAIAENTPLPSIKPTNKDNALDFLEGDFGEGSMIPNLSASGGAAGPSSAGADSANSGVAFGNEFNVQGTGSTSSKSTSKSTSQIDMQTAMILGGILIFAIVVMKKK